MDLSVMDFGEAPRRSVEVRYAGAAYRLWEATRAAMDAFTLPMRKKAKLGGGGAEVTGADLPPDHEMTFLSACLTAEGGGPVPVAVLKTWSSDVTSKLSKRLAEISGLIPPTATPESQERAAREAVADLAGHGAVARPRLEALRADIDERLAQIGEVAGGEGGAGNP